MKTKAFLLGVGLAVLVACRGGATDAPAPGAIGIVGDAPDAGVEEILAASNLPELVPHPLEGDPLGVTVHRLRNGMTVYIATDRQEPTFYGWIVVRAGSRHDPAHATGLAHYLEHMLLFKGSDELGTVDHAAEKPHLDRIREHYRELAEAKTPAARAAVLAKIDAETQQVAKYAIPNEIGRLYTGLGFTEMNAFTNKDRTYYVQKVPANRVEAWATVESERFADPVFRLFFPELEAVYEEKNRGLDSSWRTIFNDTAEGLFPQHPLGSQTTLGEVEHLKTPAFDEMIAFHQRWYVPNNMAIVLVGDIDDSVLPLLEDKFSRLVPRPLEDPPPGALPPVTGRIFKEMLAEEEEMVRVAWKTADAASEDQPALEVIHRLLDDDRTGLLNVELSQPRKVQWASASTTTYREAGFLAVDAARRDDQTLEQVETLLRTTVTKLAEVTPAQVDAAKLHSVIDRKLAAEFPQTTANRLVDTFVRQLQWADVVARDVRLAQVTRADVVAVAEKYFGPDSVVVFRRRGAPDIPKVTKPKITPLDLDATRTSDLAQRVTKLPAEPLQPHWIVNGEDVVERELPAGPLFIAKNERNDVFVLAYNWNTGYGKSPMLCESLGVHALSGTNAMAPAQFQDALYTLGSTIESRCDDDSTQVFIRGIEENLEPTLALLDAWFSSPKIEPAILKQFIASKIERRKSDLEAENMLTFGLGEFANFGERSVLLTRPSNADLRRLTPSRVRKDVRSLFDLEHRTLYSGTRSADEVAAMVAQGRKHAKTGPLPLRRYRPVPETKIYFLHRKQAKADVRITLPSAPRDPGETPRHEVLARYIGGGTGSITFREIRTKRSLAYSVSAWVDTGRPGDDLEYAGRMQNQPDKVAEAVPALLDTLRRAVVEPGRFAEARAAIDEAYRGSRVNPRSAAFVVDDWRDQGYSSDPRPGWHAAVQGLTEDSIAALLADLGGRPAIITIVGDEASIDLDALAELGELERIRPERLFRL